MTSRFRNLALLLACQAVTTLGLMVLVPVMPLYVAILSGVDTLGAARWSSLALAAPAVGALLLAPYAGRWGDRYGYRRVMLASLIVFVASLLTMALSASIYGFMLGRALQGMSALGVVLTAYIVYVGGEEARGRALGWQESAVACGALAGPVLGGVLLDYWTIEPLLVASALLTAVVGGLLWHGLSEPPRVACAAVDHDVGGFVDCVRHANLRGWLFAACLAQAGAFALVNVFALYLAARFPTEDALASTVGLLHALGWLATMLAAPLWGRLNDCGEPRLYFVLAAAGCALTLALLTVVEQLWLIALLRIAQGACYAALAQSALLACSRRWPASACGQVTGVSRGFMITGQLLGPLLVMALMPVLDPVSLVWPVVALFVAAGLLAVRGAPAALPSRLPN